LVTTKQSSTKVLLEDPKGRDHLGDLNSEVLRNVGILPQHYTASQSRRHVF